MKLPALIGLTLLVGCSSQNRPQLSTEGEGAAMPVDHPGSLKSVSREVNRVSVNQLRGTFPVVFGNDLAGNPITWKTSGGIANGLDVYSASLGEADYINVTEDDLEPSPLYVKFIDDAARDGCTQALNADSGRSDPGTRALLRYVSLTDTVATNAPAINASLRYLKLRFHGVKLEASDDDSVSGLRGLFENAVNASANGLPVTAAHVYQGWYAVCVALVTSPEFHLY